MRQVGEVLAMGPEELKLEGLREEGQMGCGKWKAGPNQKKIRGQDLRMS